MLLQEQAEGAMPGEYFGGGVGRGSSAPLRFLERGFHEKYLW